ncbi:putative PHOSPHOLIPID-TRANSPORTING ATPASE [Salix purpurea]|uniref:PHOSPHOLIPID-TRANSPORTING ATPASE n=1 Tax=Salix purpurea TaxID=77065 RepID=A0A9Q0TW80_SALPP|nr:putative PHOSPHOLIPID-TRANSPORTING ATPASE [Salix purpurea]
MNLDGETNLKLKQALESIAFMHEDSYYRDFKALIKCEDPNTNLYSFVGTLDFERNLSIPLSPQRLLLRDSKLEIRSIYTGAYLHSDMTLRLCKILRLPLQREANLRSKFEKQISTTESLLEFKLSA